MTVIKAELVQKRHTAPEAIGKIIGYIAGFCLRVLIIWWAVATWFPELGLTYWELMLPVYAIRTLIHPFVPQTLGRVLNKGEK